MDLETALKDASVPTVLVCLAHITGDPVWFQEPFRPRRDTNLHAEDSGGLSPWAQERIRAAMVTVMGELEAGERELPQELDRSFLVELMRLCVAEDVQEEYAGLVEEELQLRDRDVHWRSGSPPESSTHFKVVIVGAGISGIAAAIKLDALSIPYRILEKNPDVGGTWYENRYPESGVDTPSHFYSYSFEPTSQWGGYFSKQSEMFDYCQMVVDRYDLRPRMQFEREVVSCHWDGERRVWTVVHRGPDGDDLVEEAQVVITATGQLNRPNVHIPPGMERFTGHWFHSSQWPSGLELKGRSVGVVGTGASAMQLLRSVAAEAGSVTVFQRSPQWVRPSPDYHRSVSPATRWLMDHLPFYAGWYRFGLFWRFGDGLLRTLRRDPDWPHPDRSMNRHNDRHRRQLTSYIREELDGRPDLIEQCLPDYPPYGKRILVDNDWFKTLKKDNVKLVSSEVVDVHAHGLVTELGDRHDFDVIILATGFEAGNLLAPMDIRGRSGRPLSDLWGTDDPRAYLGMCIPDYPNLFCLYGPNTNLGHGGSVIFQAECQVRYITACIREMLEQDISAIECRHDVFSDYNKRVDDEHAQLVWSHPNVESWFRNKSGRVFSVQPWRLVDYWTMTHDPNFDDFILDKGVPGDDQGGPAGERG